MKAGIKRTRELLKTSATLELFLPLNQAEAACA